MNEAPDAPAPQGPEDSRPPARRGPEGTQVEDDEEEQGQADDRPCHGPQGSSVLGLGHLGRELAGCRKKIILLQTRKCVEDVKSRFTYSN